MPTHIKALLSKETLETLKIERVDLSSVCDEACPACGGNDTVFDLPVRLTTCNHIMGLECLRLWFAEAISSGHQYPFGCIECRTSCAGPETPRVGDDECEEGGDGGYSGGQGEEDEAWEDEEEEMQQVRLLPDSLVRVLYRYEWARDTIKAIPFYTVDLAFFWLLGRIQYGGRVEVGKIGVCALGVGLLLKRLGVSVLALLAVVLLLLLFPLLLTEVKMRFHGLRAEAEAEAETRLIQGMRNLSI